MSAVLSFINLTELTVCDIIATIEISLLDFLIRYQLLLNYIVANSLISISDVRMVADTSRSFLVSREKITVT